MGMTEFALDMIYDLRTWNRINAQTYHDPDLPLNTCFCSSRTSSLYRLLRDVHVDSSREYLITASTTPTSTVHTLHHRALGQLGLRHTTHTRGPKIRLLGLNTLQTTQLLITLFLPPRNKIRIRIILFQKPLIKFRRNGLSLII
jgi:hypothetical protein